VWFFPLSPLLGNTYCLYIILATSAVKHSLAGSMWFSCDMKCEVPR
jgi:hypothetical protein